MLLIKVRKKYKQAHTNGYLIWTSFQYYA